MGISPSNNLKFSDVPTGIKGLFSLPSAGIAQIIVLCGFIEIAWLPASQYDGYYGNDILDPEEKARKLNAELNNGRAAMLGILGNMVTECVTGQTMYEQYAANHFNPFTDAGNYFST